MFKQISKEKIRNFFLKYRTVILIGLCLLCLLILLMPSTEKSVDGEKKEVEIGDEEYVKRLEIRLEEILSQIDGVGKCKVMITLSSSEEKIYAADIEQKGDNTLTSYIKIKTDGDESTVVEKRYLPKVEGVAVVCDGAGSVSIKTAVSETVCSLLGIEMSSVCVSKRK